MVGFRVPGPYCYFLENLQADSDALGSKGGPEPRSESVRLHTTKKSYSYSISGTTGALGSMLFTESSRLPGTWYDRTDSTNMFRSQEAALGMSKFANQEFRKSAKITRQSTMSPSKVDVDIRFETRERVEAITVRGQGGIRSFVFDFDQVGARSKKLPKNADPFKPFMDMITDILDAVIALR
jgi:hypothetical protein